MELEDALKRLSGENKKFFPPPDGKMQPQIDGLDPHSQDEEESQLFKLGNAQENSAELKDKDNDNNVDSLINGYSQNDGNTNILDNEGYQDGGHEDEDSVETDDIAQGYPVQYVDYGMDPYQGW